MTWAYTGAVRRTYSRAADFAWMSNEDLGWVASLVTATNDVEAFSQAYVASIDLFNETQIYEAIESIFARENPLNLVLDDGETAQGVYIYYSMLDKEFAATFQGSATDAEDENLKVILGGPNYCGQWAYAKAGITTDNYTGLMVVDAIQNDHWTPPQNMRARTPIFTQFSNQSVAIDADTGIDTAANFVAFEAMAQRQWWRASRLRRSEKMSVGDVIKYQLIDT